MGTIRRLERKDVPALAQLHVRAYADSTRPPGSFFEEVYLDGPPGSNALPSLVHLETDGTVSGFLGGVARRFAYKGKTYTSLVLTNLMIEPAQRSGMGGPRLLRQLLSGPEDMVIADLCNAVGLKLWTALGAQVVPSFNTHWRMRSRGPSWFGLYPLLRRAKRAVSGQSFDTGAAPLCDPDTAAGRLVRSTMDATGLLDRFAECTDTGVLKPDYDLAVVKWLLRRAERKKRFGDLQVIAVDDPDGKPVGWFIYMLKRRGVSKVLQVGARGAALPGVLATLVLHARERDSIELVGRLEPRLMRALAGVPEVTTSIAEYSMLVHSRNAELLAAIHRGEVFFSELDGEWTVSHNGDPEPRTDVSSPGKQ